MKKWHLFALAAGLFLGLTAAAQPADTTAHAKAHPAPAAKQPPVATPAYAPQQPVAVDSSGSYTRDTDADEDYDYYYWDYDYRSGYDPSDEYDTQRGRDAREERDNRDQGSRGE